MMQTSRDYLDHLSGCVDNGHRPDIGDRATCVIPAGRARPSSAVVPHVQKPSLAC